MMNYVTKITGLVIFCLGMGLLLAGTANAQETIHYWSFNDGEDSELDAGANEPTSIPADIGDGTIEHELNFSSFGGSDVNLEDGFDSGQDWAITGTGNIGEAFEVAVNTEGYENIIFSSAATRTGEGYDNNTIEVSSDGGDSFSLVAENVDLDDEDNPIVYNLTDILGAVDDNSEVVVRVTLDVDEASGSGNNRYDNMKIKGEPTEGRFEDFANFPETGTSYESGTFTGQDGSTWEYVNARGDASAHIDAPTPGLQDNADAKVESGTISGGIERLNFDYKQMFGTDVELEVYVNDVLVATVTSDDEQNEVKNSGDITIEDVEGDFVLRFQNTSGGGQVAVDNVDYSDPVNIPPQTHASNLSADDIYGQRGTLSWDDGDGSSRIVIMREETEIDSQPEDDTAYEDNKNSGMATFGAGEELGDGNYVVYNGDGSSVEVQGLDPDTEYYFSVFEYNTVEGEELYLTNDAPSESFTTNDVTSFDIGFENQSFEDWYLYSAASDETWTVESNGGADGTDGYIVADNFDADEAADDWLISPAVDLTEPVIPAIDFFVLKDFEDDDNFALDVKISTNYEGSGDPGEADWSSLNLEGEGEPEDDTWESRRLSLEQYNEVDAAYIAFNYSTTGTGAGETELWQVDEIELVDLADPQLSVSPDLLEGFSKMEGEGPSDPQSFTVEGEQLDPNQDEIIINSPQSYEISTEEEGDYQETLTLNYSEDTLQPQDIYVRLKADEAGTYEEEIEVSGGGADAVTVSLSGSVVEMFAIPYFNAFRDEDDFDLAINQGFSVKDVDQRTTAGGYLLLEETGSYLETPEIDFTELDAVEIEFDLDTFGAGSGRVLSVKVSTDGGASYETVREISVSDDIDADHFINLTGRFNETDGHIKFKMTDGTGGIRFRDLNIEDEDLNLDIAEFNLLSPEDGDTLHLEGEESVEKFTAEWGEAESEAQVSYEWIASSSDSFDEAETVRLPADNDGFDAQLSMTYEELDEHLEALGFEMGEEAPLHWKVEASNQQEEQESNQTWALNVERGELAVGSIDFANLQSPFEAEIIMGHSATVYGRVRVTEDITDGREKAEDLQAWVGVSSSDTHPSEWSESAWREMEFDQGMSNFEYDQYRGRISATERGEKYFATRYQLRDQEYEYGGISEEQDVLGLDRRTRGGFWGDDNVSGKLTVNTVPAEPTEIVVDNIAELIDDNQEGERYRIDNEVIVTYIDRGQRNQHYIADETGAILIDDDNEILGDDFEIGDGMEGLQAVLGSFFETRQLVPVENPGVSSTGNEEPVFDVELSNLDSDEHQSMLVEVAGAEFPESGTFEGFENYDLIDPTVSEDNPATFTTHEFTDDLDYIDDPIPDEPLNLRAIVTEFQSEPQLTARSSDDFLDLDPGEVEEGLIVSYPIDSDGDLGPRPAENINATELSVSDGSISFGTFQEDTWQGSMPYAYSGGGWDETDSEDAKHFYFELTAEEETEFIPETLQFEERATGAGPSAFTLFINGEEVETQEVPDSETRQHIIQLDDHDELLADNPQEGVREISISMAGWDDGSRETSGGGQWRINDIRLYGEVIDPEEEIEIAAFDLLSPEDGDTLKVEGNRNREVDITWQEAVSEAEVSYTWIASESDDFEEATIEEPSNNDGLDTLLTFTYEELDQLLDDQGAETGEQVTLFWKVEADNDHTTRDSEQTYELTLERGELFDAEIDFVNIQWPFEAELTSGESAEVYSRVWIEDVTDGADETDHLTAWIGVYDENTDPAEWDDNAWSEMEFNAEGSDAAFDEYMATLDETTPGEYYYAARYQVEGGEYFYGGISDEEDQLGLGDDTRGGIWDGEDNVSGELTVEAVEVEHIAELYEEGEVDSDIVYEILGEVYLVFQQDFRNKKVVVDPTGGLGIDDAPAGIFDPGIIETEYNRYDGITGLTGRLDEFEGAVEFEPVEDPGEATSENNDIYPERVTLDELGEEHMSQLVLIEDVEFTDEGEFSTGTEYEITDPTGETGAFYTDYFSADYIEEEQLAGIPQEPVNLVGYVGVSTGDVSDDGVFITAREHDDFIDPEVITPFALDFPGDGETIEVEGGENEEVSITWEAAESEEDVVYNWIAQEPGLMYKPASFDLAADEDGAEPSLTLTLSELDMFLDAAGVDEGGQATMEWTVVAAATEGHAFRYADETRTVTLERGMVTSSEEMAEVPEEVGLDQNYPNPFNPVTTIGYQLPSDTHVELTVYNTLGQQVKTLVDERIQAGTHEVSFDASELSSGVYIYRLQADGEVITNQMTLVK